MQTIGCVDDVGATDPDRDQPQPQPGLSYSTREAPRRRALPVVPVAVLLTVPLLGAGAAALAGLLHC